MSLGHFSPLCLHQSKALAVLKNGLRLKSTGLLGQGIIVHMYHKKSAGPKQSLSNSVENHTVMIQRISDCWVGVRVAWEENGWSDLFAIGTAGRNFGKNDYLASIHNFARNAFTGAESASSEEAAGAFSRHLAHEKFTTRSGVHDLDHSNLGNYRMYRFECNSENHDAGPR
ncbi:hypothetical protein Tco_0662379 [Tanacetum coccineum]